MPKQVVFNYFEPVVACFGPSKISKCLEYGPFSDLNRVKKKGENRVFARLILDHLGCTNK